MGFLTLERYTPPPRYDPDLALWNRARIEEAAVAAGPWDVIEDAFALAPPIADPQRPPSYDFTSDNAQRDAGWYRVVWLDEDDEEQPTQPVELRLAGTWYPTVADVSDLVRARTRDKFGNEAGIFGADTRPTASSVQRLIANEAGMVTIRSGNLDDMPCPTAPEIRSAARQVIAKRVAAIIEASYRPDEVAEGRTVADFYEGSMADELEVLVQASRECRIWQPGDDPSDSTRDLKALAYFEQAPPLRW